MAKSETISFKTLSSDQGAKRDYTRNKSENLIIAYVNDHYLLEETEKIPNIGKRNKMVASLIQAYNLLPHMKCVESVPALEDELTSFHSLSYIEYLKTLDSVCDSESDLEFGLGYDCPPLDGLYNMVSRLAGGTLTAVRQLTSKRAQVAINWCGGWHHAQRDEAEGFCYVNDIVVGIEELRKVFPYVLYIDFDIHHGNGVQNAYEYTKRVLTLSLHKYEPGFYPTTGSLTERGEGPGRYHSVNVPLSEGLTDANLCQLFDTVVTEVKASFKPDAVVLQCGADCLVGDPVGNFNLTPSSLGYCVRNVLSWKLPTLVLGGGGYNKANTARCWTYLTALICNVKLPDEIPENPYFSEYGPGFDLEITPGAQPNLNHNINETIASVLKDVQNIQDRS
ncbi:histone deacetylase 8-like isoform X1 [Homalodisca vitripennis]|uniref:histone deacetylase 8-like isoform X1 n=2 Tax=Homalodisca vitripennis TaxID=197043 RepID=UPI001EEAF00E|nr:histone deacetylase 8-like isoform X1 [Homalodisca vitripennis]